MTTENFSPADGRVAWIDTGRGLAITLVVLLHCAMWLEVVGIGGAGWVATNDVLASLRMPLFFAASGLLGSAWVLRRTWRDLVPKKVLFLVWAYLVWQPLYSLNAILQAELTGDVLTPFRMVVSLGLSPVRPRFELWFLWSLALFFVLAHALANRLVRVQFAAAAVVSAFFLTSDLVTGNLGWDGTAKYYLFFLVGVYGRDLLLRFARALTTTRAVALVAVWAAVAVLTQQAGLLDVLGVSLGVRTLGLAAGIALAGLIVPLRVFGYLGSRTLAVYVAHIPMVAVAVWLVVQLGEPSWLEPVHTALPLLLTVPVIAATLVLHRLLAPVLPFLYAPPAWVAALGGRMFPTGGQGRHIAVRLPVEAPAPAL